MEWLPLVHLAAVLQLIISIGAKFVSDEFRAVLSRANETMCPSDPADEVYALRPGDLVHCGTKCLISASCMAFSFGVRTGLCRMYSCNSPSNFTVESGCGAYVRDSQRPSDCSDIVNARDQVADGVYRLCSKTNNGTFQAVEVLCDMTTDGGGWTIIQRRQDGSVDFYRNWTDYAVGFGSASGEYWLGLDTISRMTTTKRYVLRFDMTDFNDSSSYEEYDNFVVAGAVDRYRLLSIGTPSGSAGDSMCNPLHAVAACAVNMSWTTRDAQHDLNGIAGNCAIKFHGAWWYRQCHASNPNGMYSSGGRAFYAEGIVWYSLRGYYNSLKQITMKIKPFITAV